MTERQAWLKLARGIRDGRFRGGLCTALYTVNPPTAVWLRMAKRIVAYRNRYRPGHVFAWPLTPAGHRARVRFCHRQVARLTRKRPK